MQPGEAGLAPQSVMCPAKPSAEEWVFPGELPGCSKGRLSSGSSGGIVSLRPPSAQPGSPRSAGELAVPK